MGISRSSAYQTHRRGVRAAKEVTGEDRSGSKTTEVADTENRLVVAEVWGEEQTGEGGEKAQTPSYKINKSWDGMVSMVTFVNNPVLYT